MAHDGQGARLRIKQSGLELLPGLPCFVLCASHFTFTVPLHPCTSRAMIQ